MSTGREYYSRFPEVVTLRRRGWMLGLVVAMLVAAPAARAQPQTDEPPPASGPAPHERLFEGVRGFFRSIFGEGTGKPPEQQTQPEPQPSPQSPPQSSTPPAPTASPQEQAAKPAAPAPGAQTQPVEVSPSAAAVPLSLHAAIAKGDYANALKMIEDRKSVV